MTLRPNMSTLRRAGWLIMLAGHAPALWRRGIGLLAHGDMDTNLAATLGLLAATVFFFLKTLDVGWLHFRTDLRSCLVLGLLFALLHADVLARSNPDLLPPQQAILMTGALGLTAASLALRAAIRRSTQRPLDVELLAPAVCLRSSALETVAAPPPLERLHTPHGLRAPPSPSC